LAYTISNVPNWLTPSSRSGWATTTPKQISFTINAKAKTLPAGTHSAKVIFASSSAQGPQTRTVSLTIKKLPTLDISPSETLVATGAQGGSFDPGSFSYRARTSTGVLSYSISGVPNWLTISSTSGKVTTTPKAFAFALNESAKSLPVGTHTATITVRTLTTADGPNARPVAKSYTRKINLNVTGSLQVSNPTGFSVSGNEGGPFTPSSATFSLTSSGGTINYAIEGVPNWLSVSSTTGTVTAATKNVTFTINANANALPVGTYDAAIAFKNTTNNNGTTSRLVRLTVRAPHLQIDPATDVMASGPLGGPFVPSSFSYQLRASSGTLNYSITGLPNWLSASATSGTLTTAPTTITFTVNSNANALASGAHSAIVRINNSTNGQGTTTLGAGLTVNAPSQPSYLTDDNGNYLIGSSGLRILGS
jgi:hypothetical protein